MKTILSFLIAAGSFAVALDAPKLELKPTGEVIITAPADAHARYTIDGSAPNAKSGPYLAPITLRSGGKVKAIAVSADRKTVSAAAELEIPAPPDSKPPPSSVVACTQDRDFPTYDWAVRHKLVSARTAATKADLVFIGDSITQMFGGEPHDRSQPGKAVWEKYYGHRNAANLGFGYDYTENALWRIQNGELDGAAAKVVVVNIGTNNAGKNTAGEIVEGVMAVLGEIRRSKPSAKILLLGIFPRGAKPDATREKLAQVNASLAGLDGRENVTFMDVTKSLIEPDGSILKSTMSDYLHPTAEGYERIAGAIEPTLKKLLGE